MSEVKIFALISLIVWSFLLANGFDNEDFFKALCGSDEKHVDQLFGKCKNVMREGVKSCIEMSVLQIQIQRSPNVRIDYKYYQFVFCDKVVFPEFFAIGGPCLQNLTVTYNAIDNANSWLDCITAAVEALAKQENKNNMVGNGGGKSSGKSKSKKNNQVTKVVYVKRVRPGQGFRAG